MPRHGSKWEAERENLQRMADEQWSFSKIAAHYGCTKENARQACRRLGIDKPRSKIKTTQILNYLHDHPGSTAKEIAEATGIAQYYVYKVARAYGVELGDGQATKRKYDYSPVDDLYTKLNGNMIDVAAASGIPYTLVSKYVWSHIRPPRRIKATRDEARALFDQGLTYREAAERLGISDRAANQHYYMIRKERKREGTA